MAIETARTVTKTIEGANATTAIMTKKDQISWRVGSLNHTTIKPETKGEPMIGATVGTTRHATTATKGKSGTNSALTVIRGKDGRSLQIPPVQGGRRKITLQPLAKELQGVRQTGV